MDTWELVEEGRFQEAYDAYTLEYREGMSPEMSLSNRGVVLLNLQRFAEAQADFEKTLDLNKGDNDDDYLFIGVARWLQGNRTSAIEVWQSGLDTDYTDAAGGVTLPAVLLYAAVTTREKSLEESMRRLLAKRWKAKAAMNWPGPVAGFHLGQVTPEQLLASVSDVEILRDRELCQAHFHIGVYWLRAGDLAQAREHMEAACSSPFARLEVEYYLAQGELRLA